MKFNLLFSTLLAALVSGNAAAAQTQEEQYQKLYKDFALFQQAIAMDDVCEVLDAGARTTALHVVNERMAPLEEAFGDQFKPDQIAEDARTMFKGCKTREEFAAAWSIIDNAREYGAITVAAPSAAGIDPRQCTRSIVNVPTPEHARILADKALQRLNPAVRDEILALAASLKPRLEQACKEQPMAGFPSEFRPMQTAYQVLQEYRVTAAGKADPSVRSIPPSVWAGEWEAGYRSKHVFQANPAEVGVTGYRFFEANPVAASVSLTGEGIVPTKLGTLYFMRDGRVLARTFEDYHEVFLQTTGTKAVYPLKRLNPKVKPDRSKKRYAEFEMSLEVRQRMGTENARLLKFFLGSRMKPNAAESYFYHDTRGAAFVKPDTAVLSLFEVNRAFDFATAPSALNQ